MAVFSRCRSLTSICLSVNTWDTCASSRLGDELIGANWTCESSCRSLAGPRRATIAAPDAGLGSARGRSMGSLSLTGRGERDCPDDAGRGLSRELLGRRPDFGDSLLNMFIS